MLDFNSKAGHFLHFFDGSCISLCGGVKGLIEGVATVICSELKRLYGWSILVVQAKQLG